jgi:ATP-dependent DNA ligase
MLKPPIAPMLAKLSSAIPEGWLYEPKWDGFRCLIFWDGDSMFLQSRDQKPFNRYFPELEQRLPEQIPQPAVLDGEIVIAGPQGLDFEALLLRIHPAASRVRLLAEQTPAAFVAFDLLALGEESLMETPQAERRSRLERLLSNAMPPLYLTPATGDIEKARDWFSRFEGAGLDGIVARPPHGLYTPDRRSLVKVKHARSADCVVGGFRWLKNHQGEAVGSLLLGVYDGKGVLHYVGFASNFQKAQRVELLEKLQPYRDNADGATFGQGRTPGGPSRWTGGRDLSWVPLRPELVCEVTFEQLQGDKFRHSARFRRWRPDKPARDCRYDQLETAVPFELTEVFGKS